MAGIVIRDVLASLPTASGLPGGTLGQLTTDEELYIVKGGAWLNLRTGGAVTGAGDWTGASSANTVVGLTGTANVVAVHGTSITRDGVLSGAGLSLSIIAGATSDSAAGGELILRSGGGLVDGDMTLRRASAAPFLVAQGSGGGEFVQLRGGPQAYIDADTTTLRNNSGDGIASWTTAGLAFAAALSSVAIIHESDSGVGAVTSIFAQTSTNLVGGNLILGSGSGGGGNLPGSVHVVTGISTPALSIVAGTPTPTIHSFCDSFRFDKSLLTAAIFQEQHTNDTLCHDLLIQSQAPWASATGPNKLPGNIVYVVPAAATGGDPQGQHRFYVAGSEILNLTTFSSTLNSSLVFSDEQILLSQALIYCEIAANDTDASPITFAGQQAGISVSDKNGGRVNIVGGPAASAGIPGGVSLITGDSNLGLHLASSDASHHAVAIAGPTFLTSDLSPGITCSLHLGDSAGAPGAPSNGSTLGSSAGRPFFITSASHAWLYDGNLRAVGTVGALDGYTDVEIDGLSRCMPYYLRS